MSHWVYGIDVSFDEVSLAEAQMLHAAGVQVAVQCLWTGAVQPPYRVTNLRNFVAAGIIPLGYASIGTSGTGDWHMQQGRNGIPDDLWGLLRKVAVDVELQGNTVAQVRSAVDKMALFGKTKDIYTSYNALVNYLSNPLTFTDCGLWNAYWDGAGDIDFSNLPYGGWRIDQIWAEQWSGGTYLQGVYADRNQFRASALGIVEPIPPPNTPAPIPPPQPTDTQWLKACEIIAHWELATAQQQIAPTALKAQLKFLLTK